MIVALLVLTGLFTPAKHGQLLYFGSAILGAAEMNVELFFIAHALGYL